MGQSTSSDTVTDTVTLPESTNNSEKHHEKKGDIGCETSAVQKEHTGGEKNHVKRKDTGMEKVEEFVLDIVTWIKYFAINYRVQIRIIFLSIFWPIILPVMLIKGFVHNVWRLSRIVHLAVECVFLQLQLFKEMLIIIHNSEGTLAEVAAKIVNSISTIADIMNSVLNPATWLASFFRVDTHSRDGRNYRSLHWHCPEDSEGTNEIIISDDESGNCCSDGTNKSDAGLSNGASTSSKKHSSKGAGSSKSEDSGTGGSTINDKDHVHTKKDK